MKARKRERGRARVIEWESKQEREGERGGGRGSGDGRDGRRGEEEGEEAQVYTCYSVLVESTDNL